MRRTIAALVALGITLALPLAAPQSAQAATRKTKVSISVSATKITQGKYLTIKGKVKPATAGRTVVLQHKMDGSYWKNEVKLVTNASGVYTSTGQVTKLQNRSYRVYVPKYKKLKAAYSKAIYVRVVAPPAPPAPVQHDSSVTITASPASVNAGASFTVTGIASANLIGKRVVLSATNTSGSWDVASATVAGDGTFNITGSISTAGARQTLTVYAPSTNTTRYSQSGSPTVDVYGWYSLYDMSSVQSNGDGYWGKESTTANGQFFDKSIYWDGGSGRSASLQYDLARKCTTFSATLGWRFDSNSNDSAIATVAKDSVVAWTTPAPVKLTTLTPVSVDVSGALRLKLGVTTTYSDGDHFVWGSAKILCAF